jgi:predicted nucleic acid-binding protein
MSFVLDASVTMRWFFGDGTPQGLEYAFAVFDILKSRSAVVPVTWSLEIANVILRAETKELTPKAHSQAFIERLEGMDIKTDHATYEYALSDTLNLARKYNLSSYDASYLELAMRLESPLATLDEDLRKAAEKAGVKDVV